MTYVEHFVIVQSANQGFVTIFLIALACTCVKNELEGIRVTHLHQIPHLFFTQVQALLEIIILFTTHLIQIARQLDLYWAACYFSLL